jgi:hypothetical protein
VLGFVQAFMDGAICFFVPFLAASPHGSNSVIDIFSVGKTIYICMLGVVTMELMIVARYWTWWFAVICMLSYILVYPFLLVFPLVLQAAGTWDMSHSGIGANIVRTPFFWISLFTVYSMAFSIRYLDRSVKWLFRPDDNMIRAELEVLNKRDPDRFSVYEQNAARANQSAHPPTRLPPADDPNFVRTLLVPHAATLIFSAACHMLQHCC